MLGLGTFVMCIFALLILVLAIEFKSPDKWDG